MTIDAQTAPSGGPSRTRRRPSSASSTRGPPTPETRPTNASERRGPAGGGENERWCLRSTSPRGEEGELLIFVEGADAGVDQRGADHRGELAGVQSATRDLLGAAPLDDAVATVVAEHDVRPENRDEGVEVAVVRSGEVGVDDLPTPNETAASPLVQ